MKFIHFCFFEPLTENNLEETNEFIDKRYLSDESSQQGNLSPS